MRRSNVYLTEKQVERLRERTEKEGVAQAELIRRAIDAFLAWIDPTYATHHAPKGTPFFPVLGRTGLYGPHCNVGYNNNKEVSSDTVPF